MDPLNFFPGVVADFPGRAVCSLKSLPLDKKFIRLGAEAINEQ
jgi:hypothetical protein